MSVDGTAMEIIGVARRTVRPRLMGRKCIVAAWVMMFVKRWRLFKSEFKLRGIGKEEVVKKSLFKESRRGGSRKS